MRYIKKFETIKNLENAWSGDYVICREEDVLEPELSNFINNNVGTISHIAYGINFYIYYDNVPENLKHRFNDVNGTRLMKKNEILMCSDNREELEYYVSANKYNL
jgi:hypothetical protein